MFWHYSMVTIYVRIMMWNFPIFKYLKASCPLKMLHNFNYTKLKIQNTEAFVYYHRRIKCPLFLFFIMSPHARNRPFYSTAVILCDVFCYLATNEEQGTSSNHTRRPGYHSRMKSNYEFSQKKNRGWFRAQTIEVKECFVCITSWCIIECQVSSPADKHTTRTLTIDLYGILKRRIFFFEYICISHTPRLLFWSLLVFCHS